MWCYGLLFVFYCGGVAPVDSYCAIAQPIYWSARDTRKTKEQVDRHNRVLQTVCKR